MRFKLLLLIITFSLSVVTLANEACNPTKGSLSSCLDAINAKLNKLEQENHNLELQLSLTKGLVAYYPFDNNANDGSGHALHGENNGTTLVTGKIRNAYQFDGENSRIKLPVSAIQGSELTVNFWIKTGDDIAGIISGANTPFKIEGLWLGGDQDAVNGGWDTNQQFKGLLDELRIYNRILSDSEIDNLYRLAQ